MDEEKLITLVEQNKCLWASSHKEYKNQYMRQQAWKSIAAVLNSTGKHVTDRQINCAVMNLRIIYIKVHLKWK